MRSGILARKVGMTRVFHDDGAHVPVTVLHVDVCQVTAQRTIEKDGYCALQLGAGTAKPKRLSRAERQRFSQAKVAPKKKLVEFRVSPEHLVDIGAELTADHFKAGQKIDVAGLSIGKGFAGAMKRHGFSGLRATHGVSVSHRSHGSTGQCQDPGRVFKGKKMAGHMGAKRITAQNLEVVRTDAERGLILVKGAVPGAKGGWLEVCDAIKGTGMDDLPLPAAFRMPSDVAAGGTVRSGPSESAKADSGESDQNGTVAEKGSEKPDSDSKDKSA